MRLFILEVTVTDHAAARADERAVPLRKSLLIRRVVVLPDEDQEESKDASANQGEESQRRRGHS